MKKNINDCLIEIFNHETLVTELLKLLGDMTVDGASKQIPLARIVNELSVLGYPPLISVAKALITLEEEGDLWLCMPLISALNRVNSCVSVEEALSPQVFTRSEEEHLFDQLHSLLIDFSAQFPLKSLNESERLRERLWISATRWLMDQAHSDLRLWRLLVELSNQLGDLLEVSPEEFMSQGINLLAQRLRDTHLAGGTLSIVLPCQSDHHENTQLKESALLNDLRGLEHLKLEGYHPLEWLPHSQQELSLLKKLSLEVNVLTQGEMLSLNRRGLLPLLWRGIHDKEQTRKGLTHQQESLNTPVDLERLEQVARRVGAFVDSGLNHHDLSMVYIPAGCFMMGSEQSMGHDQERPRHRVRLTSAFAMSQMPITQSLWQSVMGFNPSAFVGENHPVESMTWYECVAFCNALSQLAGLQPVYAISEDDPPHVKSDITRNGFRLPTEAEWEYAALAGENTRYAGSETIGAVAWYNGNSEGQTHSVGEKAPNAWGLHDMTGNVEEWLQDEFHEYSDDLLEGVDPIFDRSHDALRVSRGGSWNSIARFSRIQTRCAHISHLGYSTLGFRVARSLGNGPRAKKESLDQSLAAIWEIMASIPLD